MARSPIIVGIDGSQHSRDALGWAVREATLRDVPLLLVCATTYRRTNDGPDLARELRDRADRVLATPWGSPGPRLSPVQSRSAGKCHVSMLRERSSIDPPMHR